MLTTTTTTIQFNIFLSSLHSCDRTTSWLNVVLIWLANAKLRIMSEVDDNILNACNEKPRKKLKKKKSSKKDEEDLTIIRESIEEDHQPKDKTVKKKKEKREKSEDQEGSSKHKCKKSPEEHRDKKNPKDRNDKKQHYKEKKNNEHLDIGECEERGENKLKRNSDFDKDNDSDPGKRRIKKKKKHSKEEKDDTKEEQEQTTKNEDSSSNIRTECSKEGQVDVGQWGKATFESDSQRDKFLRLLGGFKKGNIEKNKQELGKQRFSSAAMGKKEEEKLKRKLELQYEQAFDTTRNKRGLGLGYEPEQDKELKSFYIDKNASSSTKLE